MKTFPVTLAVAVAVVTAGFSAVSQTARRGPPPAQPLPQVTAEISTTLQQACLPILSGAKADAAARSAGFKLKDGVWTRDFGGKGQIELFLPDHANPHTCSVTITLAGSSERALHQAVETWVKAQTPPLNLLAGQSQATGGSWATSIWSAKTPKGVESVVLSEERPTAGAAPANLQSNLLMSLTPA